MTKLSVEQKLIEIGMPTNLKGFNYIADAIVLLDKPEWRNPKWTALYYVIGTINNDKAANVERSIRTAFERVRSKNNSYMKVEKYIGYVNCDNSSSLTRLYINLRSEYTNSDLEIISKLRELFA